MKNKIKVLLASTLSLLAVTPFFLNKSNLDSNIALAKANYSITVNVSGSSTVKATTKLGNKISIYCSPRQVYNTTKFASLTSIAVTYSFSDWDGTDFLVCSGTSSQPNTIKATNPKSGATTSISGNYFLVGSNDIYNYAGLKITKVVINYYC